MFKYSGGKALQGFSEEELLILSNYAYFSCSTSKGTIGENIDLLKKKDGSFDVDKILAQGAVSCNISESEAVELLKRIDGNEKLRNLSATRKLEEKDIRGICYVNSKANNKLFADGQSSVEAVVVFRGTGGTYNAWYDNVQGEYMTDTKLQKVAKDFVKNECSEYGNITVTGHSKGGNLAQYVTVTCGEQIGKCVSFDGQGFGKEFIKKYGQEIETAKPKITCVAAYNDYVNILLYGIAGSVLYVKNSGKNIDGHSSYTLLDSIVFNEKGEINRRKSGIFQGPVASKLEESLDNAVSLIDMLPKDGKEKASNILAAALAGFMGYDKDEYYKKDRIDNAVNDFKSYAASLVGLYHNSYYEVNITNERNYYSGSSMISAAESMLEAMKNINALALRVESAKRTDKMLISAKKYTDASLDKIADKLYGISGKLKRHEECLKEIYRIFENDDTGLRDGLNEVVSKGY